MSKGEHGQSIVRIYQDAAVVGAGVLLDNRHIVTCQHVAANALKPLKKRGAVVEFDFPLIDKKRRSAKILKRGSDSDRDIAVLKTAVDIPTEATGVRWTEAATWGEQCRIFGFPAGYQDGIWVEATLRAVQASGWVQIDSTTHAVAPGFSGSVVWSNDNAGAIGIVVAADASNKIACLLPWTTLKKPVQNIIRTQRSVEALQDVVPGTSKNLDRRRGSILWEIEAVSGDALSQFLNDLVANRDEGFPDDVCTKVSAALDKIANYSAGLADAIYWQNSILARVESFVDSYREWNKIDGSSEDVVRKRESQMKDLRKMRRNIARMAKTGQERLAIELSRGLGKEAYDALGPLCKQYPRLFRNLRRAMKRLPERIAV